MDYRELLAIRKDQLIKEQAVYDYRNEKVEVERMESQLQNKVNTLSQKKALFDSYSKEINQIETIERYLESLDTGNEEEVL